MTCPNATDPAEKANRALDAEKRRSEFRMRAFETLLLYLITYEMPVEKVRTFLERIETQALRGFPDLLKAGWRADATFELLERLRRVEGSTVARALRIERCQKCGFFTLDVQWPGQACECWKESRPEGQTPQQSEAKREEGRDDVSE